MKVVLPGGSGQVGAMLARDFMAKGHDVTVLSRKAYEAPWRVVAWDAETLGDWVSEIDGADVVINLAGRSVNCRYTAENRGQMMDSRVNSTRVIGKAIACVTSPPSVWLQSSTATIYSHRYDAPNDELTGLIGGSEPNAPSTWKFSIEVAQAWERTLDEADVPGTRKVKLRSAMIMSPDRGGVFDTLLALVRFGLGGTEGKGDQYLSWIHHKDFVKSIHWIIDHKELDGPVNLCAPNPEPNALFMRHLREAWCTRIGLPAMEWMLEIGTFLLQSETELVLKSRRVVPTRLLQDGFTFDFPYWAAAASDLCREWRIRR